MDDVSTAVRAQATGRRRGRFSYFFLTALVVLLYLPALVVTALYWTVAGLYAACAAGAYRTMARSRKESVMIEEEHGDSELVADSKTKIAFLEVDNYGGQLEVGLKSSFSSHFPEAVKWSEQCNPGDALAFPKDEMLIVCLNVTRLQWKDVK